MEGEGGEFLPYPIHNRVTNALVFITQPYLAVRNTIRLNVIHYFIIKIPNKQELEQFPDNHSSHTDFKGFVNIYKNLPQKSFLFTGD